VRWEITRAIHMNAGPAVSLSPATDDRWLARFRLAFRQLFCLDRSVPVDDQMISPIAVGGSAQNGGVAFTTTHWSVVLKAQGESPSPHLP
jgi:hypothetical protein